MIRSAQILFRVLPLMPMTTPTVVKVQQPKLLRANRFFYSMSSQDILEMIKNEKYEKNLDKICIYMANMSNKEDAVQQVLEKVFTKEFSPAVIQH